MKNKNHVCPWWVGYLLLSPLRKISQNPKKILAPFVAPGMTVLDFGSAMGYFSLPMAEAVGDSGRVVCVDIQEKMLAKLKKRAQKAKLDSRIEPMLVTGKGYGLQSMKERFDFALVFAVVHEVPDQSGLFSALYDSLKPGGTLLFAEPAGHVKKDSFAASVALAKQIGFSVVEDAPLPKGLAVLLSK